LGRGRRGTRRRSESNLNQDVVIVVVESKRIGIVEVKYPRQRAGLLNNVACGTEGMSRIPKGHERAGVAGVQIGKGPVGVSTERRFEVEIDAGPCRKITC